MNRGRAGGAEPAPSGSHPPNSADSSGWQEGHEAQSLERLLKDQGTDVSPCSSAAKLGPFFLISPEPQKKPGVEIRRRMSCMTLETGKLPPSTFFPFS